jgi:hypothetical protein
VIIIATGSANSRRGFVVLKGVVAEEGTQDELVAKGGIYAELSVQAGSDRWSAAKLSCITYVMSKSNASRSIIVLPMTQKPIVTR